MRTWRIVTLFCVGHIMLAVPAAAHHAFTAEFDANRPLLLEGKVTRVEWINPHSWIHIEVTQEDGTAVLWEVEAGTPNTLFRRGLTRDSLPIGTEIIVQGYAAKDDSNKANGRNLTYTDGTTVFMGSSGTGAPLDGTDPTAR